jgi:hypothetical protein
MYKPLQRRRPTPETQPAQRVQDTSARSSVRETPTTQLAAIEEPDQRAGDQQPLEQPALQRARPYHFTILPSGAPLPPTDGPVTIQASLPTFHSGGFLPIQRGEDLAGRIQFQIGKGMLHPGGVSISNPSNRFERTASDTAARGTDGLSAQRALVSEAAGPEEELAIQRMPSPLLRQDRVGKTAATSGMLAAGLAGDKMRQAAKDEPAITKVISGTVAQQGGKMYGLEYRLKTEDSLARKIHETAPKEKLTEEEYAARVKDAVRYTAHFPEAKYTAGVNSTMAALKSGGYMPYAGNKPGAAMKNTWRPDSPYRGLNTWWQTPDGTIFEVQFHTPESQRIKNINHELYDEERLAATTEDRRKQLKQEMQENARGIPLPSGGIQIGMPRPLLRQPRVGKPG